MILNVHCFCVKPSCYLRKDRTHAHPVLRYTSLFPQKDRPAQILPQTSNILSLSVRPHTRPKGQWIPMDSHIFHLHNETKEEQLLENTFPILMTPRKRRNVVPLFVPRNIPCESDRLYIAIKCQSRFGGGCISKKTIRPSGAGCSNCIMNHMISYVLYGAFSLGRVREKKFLIQAFDFGCTYRQPTRGSQPCRHEEHRDLKRPLELAELR